ncbi:MAG: hypothetical protein IJQ65_00615 [Kiritimatiellae bacterium]|nr:hypothetical protein [Kiritimatiellia bacterium]
MQKKAILVGLALLALVAAVVWLVAGTGGDGQTETDNADRGKTKSGIATKSTKGAKARPAKKEPKAQPIAEKKARRHRVSQELFDDPDHPYSAEDKRISQSLQDALDGCTADTSEDDDDSAAAKRRQANAQKRLMKAAAAAAASSNPSVRMRAVDAFSWVGKDALTEMTPMMADANEGVAEQAIEGVQQALLDVDDANDRFQLATAYMSTFSANEDALSMLNGISSGAALELVDPASDSPSDVAAAQKNREFFVETVNALLEGGEGKCVEQARILYEDVTGSRWIDAAEASRWAQDPDSYEAPEEPEAAEAPAAAGA